MADEEQSTVDDGDSAAAAAEPTEPAVEPDLLFEVPVTESRGQVVLHPDRDGYVALVQRLRAAGYWMCVDLCGVDYLGHTAGRWLPPGTAPERFEVVLNLLNQTDRTRIRVRLQVAEDDAVVPTISHLHPGVSNHERETFDLFGIAFDGHPDLSRILMPPDWVGHPLRKDDPASRIPVQFKGAAS
jgi:NADH-quinone oxidoreductase subunit C